MNDLSFLEDFSVSLPQSCPECVGLSTCLCIPTASLPESPSLSGTLFPLEPPSLIRQNAQTSLTLPAPLDQSDNEVEMDPASDSCSTTQDDTILNFMRTTTAPIDNPTPGQIISEALRARVESDLSSAVLVEAFETLARALEEENKSGDGDVYHAMLNMWFSARLSKPNTAYMMIKYFKLGRQVCHMFEVIQSDRLLRRILRGLLRHVSKNKNA